MSRFIEPTGARLLRGLAAVALFVVIAGTVVLAEFEDAVGYGDISSLEAIGYSMIPAAGISDATLPAVFLVPLLLLALVLDAALEGAIYLARTDEGDHE